MNPITRVAMDSMPEPMAETPRSAAPEDEDDADFGLALATASAAQPQSATAAHQRPAGTQATPGAPGREAADGDGAAPDGGAPGSTTAPAPPGEAQMNARVLDLVRGLTEQAARVALDSAAWAGTEAAEDPAASLAKTQARAASPDVAVIGNLLGRGVLERQARITLRSAAEAAAAASEASVRGKASQQAGPGAAAGRSAHASGDATPGSAPGGAPAPADPGPSVASAGRGGASGAEASPAPLVAGTPAVPAAGGSFDSGAATSAAGAARAATFFEPPPTPLRAGDQVTLQFGGEDGLEGSLRVAVRGQTVRATILSSDPNTAERLSRGLGELQRALGERGFSEARLSVQQTTRSHDSERASAQSGHGRDDARQQDESHERHPAPRQERESQTAEERPRRRPSRPRAER